MTGGKNYGCKNVDGKVAIISGASYGMGQTMAELFAEEGAKVVMTAQRLSGSIRIGLPLPGLSLFPM